MPSKLIKTKYDGLFLEEKTGTYYIVKMINRKYIRKSLRTKNLKEARFKFDLYFNDSSNFRNYTKANLFDVVDQYIEHCYEVKQLSTQTMLPRISRMNKLKRFFNNIEVSEISHRDIERYLISERGKSKVTLNNDIIEFRSLFKWMMTRPNKDRPYIFENPLKDIQLYQVNRRTQKAIPVEVVKSFLEFLESRDHELFVISKFTFLLGLRISEVNNLKTDDIDLKNKTVTIRNTKGFVDRTSHLNDSTSEFVKTLLNEFNKSDYLLNEFSYSAIAKRLKRKLNQFNVENKSDHEITFHIFRHTFGSTLAEKGVPVAVISSVLGHKDIQTTMIYLNIQDDRTKEAFNLIE